jgi:transcriptional regulator with XRE-family HTH domain
MTNKLEALSEAKILGNALRHMRIKKKWSLKEFEVASGGKIKDVVLGSYERGARSISVAKLKVIAETYEVPITTFFEQGHRQIPTISSDHLVIDLRKLREALKNTESITTIALDQYTKTIINLRRDWNGEVLSLRSADLSFLGMNPNIQNEELGSFFYN